MPNKPTPRVSRDSLIRRTSSVLDRLIRPGKTNIEVHPASIESLVVIKLCCLGDMLMATPAIRALNRHFFNAEITVVTDEWTAPAIESNPRIDRIILTPDSSGVRTVASLGYQLREYKFDLGVCLDRSPVPALALWAAGIPVRAGIDSEQRGIGLSHRATPEDNQHETDLYLAAIETLGVRSDDRSPEFVVPDEAVIQVDERLPRREQSPLAVIHAGGAINPGVAMLEKRWPATNFGELASLLVREAGANVVLVGTDTDRQAVDTVRDFAKAPLIDLCGQLSLTELAALCRRASLFVGNDTGAAHLASAVGTPVVSIFGPTNPNRYQPLGRRTVVCAPPSSWNIHESADLRYVDRRNLPDIATVPLPQVLNACLQLLGEHA